MRGWYFHCPSHHFVLNVSTLPRPFPWPKELTGKSIFNFTWGKSFALRRTGVPSSYHDWHNNSRRGSPWPPRDHERPVPACPDRLMTWRIILLLTTVAVYCINNMNIDTLDTRHYHWNSRTPNHILGLSTAISILYLPLLSTSWIWVAWSVPSWLPCGCFVRKIGSACRTWRQLRGRWCF